MRAVAVLLSRGGRVLAVRRPPEGLLGGMWELPGGELAGREAPARGLERSLRERLGLHARRLVCVGQVRHRFTHRELQLHVFRGQASAGRVKRNGFDAHRWVGRKTLDGLPLSKLARKALALVSDG